MIRFYFCKVFLSNIVSDGGFSDQRTATINKRNILHIDIFRFRS